MPYDTLLFVFFVILLLIDIRKTISNTSFSKENTDLYKGICTLMVFCHHLSQRVDGSIFLFCGYLAVAGFFLVSGHGLMCSFKSNGLYYIRVIIMKKVPQLLLMCAVAVSISIVYFSILGERVSFLEVGGVIKGNRLLNWFFPAIICLYFFFALSFAIAKDNTKLGLILLSGFIAIFTLVLLVEYVNGDIGLHWFISLYSFLIGAFFSAYPQVRIVNLNRLLYYLALFVLCLSYYLVHYTYIWSNKVAAVILLALHYVNSALFSVLLFEFVKGYRSIVFFEYIGQNSAEIILTQTMALHLFRNNCIYIENIYLYIVLSILAQVLFVILLRPAYKYAKNIFR